MSNICINQRQASAIIGAMEIGRKIQQDIGEPIAVFYRAGGTFREAANAFEITKKYGIKGRTAVNSVRYAICGLDEEELRVQGYDGLIKDKEKLKQIARQHKINVTLERGEVYWSDEENELLYSLTSDSYFQEKRGVRGIRMAQALNGTFHNGEEIRSGNAARAQLRKIKTRLEKSILS